MGNKHNFLDDEMQNGQSTRLLFGFGFMLLFVYFAPIPLTLNTTLFMVILFSGTLISGIIGLIIGELWRVFEDEKQK